MVNQDLIELVRNYFLNGYSKDQIFSFLVDKSWSKEEIEECISFVEKEKQKRQESTAKVNFINTSSQKPSEDLETSEPPKDQFSLQLQKEALKWQEKKIIKKDQVEKILLLYKPGGEEELATKQKSRIVKIFSIMGAVLIGLGIILFVASNWRGVPSFLKATLLILTTLGMYYGGWWFRFKQKTNPKIGMALIFLGALVFGASLILIAQSYHIRIEYSNLILLWALVIIPAAYFTRSEPTLMLSSALVLFWGIFSVYEDMGFFSRFQEAPSLLYLYISFLMIVGGMTPFAYQLGLPKFQGVNILGVLTWFGFISALSWFKGSYNPIFNVLLLLLILGGLIYGIGEVHQYLAEKYKIFKDNYLRIGLISVLFTSFILTFPQIYYYSFFGKGYSGIAALFNFILVAEICGVIYLGVKKREEYYINYGSLFFALLIFARYFSLTWGLGARAFVFIFGGILLILGGYFIEKQRKKIIKSFKEGETFDRGKQF